MTNQTPPLLVYLEDKGITLQSLIDSALEMYVPHPGIETVEKATVLLKEEFLEILKDVNVSTLIVAAFHAARRSRKRQNPRLNRNASWADQDWLQTN